MEYNNEEINVEQAIPAKIENKKGKTGLAIFFTAIICVAIIGPIAFLFGKNMASEQEVVTTVPVTKEVSESPKTEETTTVPNAEQDRERKIVEAYKKYHTSKGLAMISDIKEWNAVLVEEKGEYVKLSVVFSCLSGKDDCVYVSQLGDEDDLSYCAFVKGKFENGEYIVEEADDHPFGAFDIDYEQ